MARIILDLESETVGKIREVLEKGHYNSLEEFVWISISNQLFLESTDISSTQWRSTEPGRTPMKESVEDPLAILDLAIQRGDMKLIQVPSSSEPLWGMYYRFLPLKIVVRCIANIGGGSYDVITAQVGNAALELGDRIREFEKRMSVKRGYGISQGLPGRRSDVNASIGRYVAMFLGSTLKKTGEVHGMMHEAGFGTIKEGEVTLSDVGLRFAGLRNPVIDESDLKSPLSGEEKVFLLTHVKKEMSGEYEFMKTYSKSLLDGPSSPAAISLHTYAYLRKRFPNRDMTESVMATMTSGVQSRMVELGLVSFNRAGTTSIYSLTDSGKTFLKGGIPND